MKIRAKKMPSWLGFMFASKNSLNETIYFDLGRERKVCLHMIFVFFKINVYLLDKNKKVIEIRRELKPFKMYSFLKKAQYVIESRKELRIRIGGRVTFK